MTPFRDSPAQLARRLRLTYEPSGGVMAGERAGVRVVVQPLWEGGWGPYGPAGKRSFESVRLVARVPAFGIPGLTIRPQTGGETVAGWVGLGDLRVGDPAVDASFFFSAVEPGSAAALLAGPSILPLLRHCAGRELSAGDGEVSLVVHASGALEMWLDHLAALALALANTENPVMRQAREQLGLVLENHRLKGAVDGVAVEVWAEAMESWAYVARAPWPTTIKVRARAEGEVGVSMNDPILDRLVVVTADDREEARRVLPRDAVRGPLLDAVCGRGGSARNGWLTTRARHDVADLVAAVRGLAEAVSGIRD